MASAARGPHGYTRGRDTVAGAALGGAMRAADRDAGAVRGGVVGRSATWPAGRHIDGEGRPRPRLHRGRGPVRPIRRPAWRRAQPRATDTVERLLAAAPRLSGRYLTHRKLTIVHGDAHSWNVFHPT